jgi:hypothetical protein
MEALMILLRIVLHTVIGMLVLTILAGTASMIGIPLVSGLLEWLNPGSFLAFSLTLAALLNRRPLLLFVLLGVCLLVCFPLVQTNPAGFLLAVLLGAATAFLAGALFREGAVPE